MTPTERFTPRLQLATLLLGLALMTGGTAGAIGAKPEAFLERHCYDCHDGDVAKGKLNLEALGFTPEAPASLVPWLDVIKRVETGEMPPAKKRQPTPEERRAFLAILRQPIVAAERQRIARDGRSTVRRLSKVEHGNALRDLLRLPRLPAADKLPDDELSDGYGKSSSALPFSHIQIGRYLEVAEDAVRAAMAPQRAMPKSEKIRVWVADVRGQTVRQRYANANGQPTLILSKQSPFLYGALKGGNGMPMIDLMRDTTLDNWPGDFSKRKPGYVLDQPPFINAVGILNHGTGQIGQDFKARHNGRYKLRVGAFSFRANRGQPVATDRTEVVAFYSDTRLLGHVDVTPTAAIHELDVWLNAGEQVSVSAASLPLWRIEPKDRKTGLRYPVVDSPAIAFQGFEMEGPLNDQWPPANHRRLFGDLPMKPLADDGKTSDRDYDIVAKNPLADARRLLRGLMAEAYRRPVTEADFRVPMASFRKRNAKGAPFQECMVSAFAAVLSSPHFVLQPMNTGRLSAGQFANRLSLFLWNTPADRRLRRQLTAELFTDPKRLAVQVTDMINDARSERFIRHFVDHWLDLRNISLTEPDENLYSGYYPWLKESMLLETYAYFGEMLRGDLGARAVIDSDFALLNGALSELYGIPGGRGGNVQRVNLPADSRRGGLLTQASVLKVTANGTTTSPVVRGNFVMDRLLGDPPPPPPEAVPAVEPDISGVTTIREQLSKHAADPNCAACHAKIDPPGFALEAFDVMGAFRERYHSLEKGQPVKGALTRRAKPVQYKLALPVDDSGELPDGRRFRDVEDFRRLVLADDRQIARNLLERLIVYATGAPVGIADRETVEAILDQTRPQGYGLRSMIVALVASPLFQNK